MKTVAGPTDRVVVVGAGLSGLSAALHLVAAGRQVTVLERADHPGGRVGRYRGPDYEIDSGATILTLPELIDEVLGVVGQTRESVGLRILEMTPAYRARFADGSVIGVYSEEERMAEELEQLRGARVARNYRRLRGWLKGVYDAEFRQFMDTNFDSPLDMVRIPEKRVALSKLVRLGAFGRLGPKVGAIVRDSHVARLFSFQALFAGTAPNQALGVYGAIPYMDTCLGVYYPEGGMRAIAEALGRALTLSGGTLELNADVIGIDYRGKRATAVRTADGRVFDCDAVVVTADIGSLPRFGLRHRRGLRASPSAVVAHGTVPAEIARTWPVQAHHTIDFGHAWDRTFAEIAARPGRGRLMSDPSLLLTRPALTDPSLHIDREAVRYEPLSLLAPCPNLAAAPLDWDQLTPFYLRELLQTLEARGYQGISEHFRVDHVDTPRTWQARGMLAGTPFSAAHLFRQTGPFRTRNLVRGHANVVLAGSGTVPGVGVPTVLLSGKLAAARIAGDARHAVSRSLDAGAVVPAGKH
ncbi:phytoene desaturase family protein [Nocardia sp. CDC160]|uniref:phytoene desaturase family protein n=1 Tax=Nocardia sp. CDC160 TaxID=3112166 RepID=UPI002DB70A50|nr:phytoene desaturase family protein [Nocardia sp. CDC160]MEC3920087.1 phytoene desaturase family protein [Nocardia sp. CDC160]